MSSFRLRHPRREDAASVAQLVIDQETALYGTTTYTPADLDVEWAELDLERNAWVAESADGVAAYASLHDRGELYRAELYVQPHDDAVAAAVLDLLERVAAERGARRLQIGPFE